MLGLEVFAIVFIEDNLIAEDLEVAEHPKPNQAIKQRSYHNDVDRFAIKRGVKHVRLFVGVRKTDSLSQILNYQR